MGFKQAFEFLLFSNIFIACCAVATTYATFICLGQPTVSLPLLLLIGSATIAIYILHRVLNINRVHLDKLPMLLVWSQHNRVLLLILIAISGSVAGSTLLYGKLRPETIATAVGMGVVAMLYVMPVYRSGGKWIRLRDIRYIKIFMIALVWAVMTAWLPALESGVGAIPEAFLLSIERFLFVLAITLPFDIRDAHVDRLAGLKTIPHVLGSDGTKMLAYLLLAVFSGICVGHFWLYPGRAYLLPALLVSALLTGWLIRLAEPSRNDWYFYGLLDGTLLIQALLLWRSQAGRAVWVDLA